MATLGRGRSNARRILVVALWPFRLGRLCFGNHLVTELFLGRAAPQSVKPTLHIWISFEGEREQLAERQDGCDVEITDREIIADQVIAALQVRVQHAKKTSQLFSRVSDNIRPRIPGR